jgi:hypothetical protein
MFQNSTKETNGLHLEEFAHAIETEMHNYTSIFKFGQRVTENRLLLVHSLQLCLKLQKEAFFALFGVTLECKKCRLEVRHKFLGDAFDCKQGIVILHLLEIQLYLDTLLKAD